MDVPTSLQPTEEPARLYQAQLAGGTGYSGVGGPCSVTAGKGKRKAEVMIYNKSPQTAGAYRALLMYVKLRSRALCTGCINKYDGSRLSVIFSCLKAPRIVKSLITAVRVIFVFCSPPLLSTCEGKRKLVCGLSLSARSQPAVCLSLLGSK